MDLKKSDSLTKWIVVQSVANKYLEDIYGALRKHMVDSIDAEYYVMEQQILQKYKSNYKKQDRETRNLYRKKGEDKKRILSGLTELRDHARKLVSRVDNMEHDLCRTAIEYLEKYVDNNIKFTYENNTADNRD